MPIPGHTGAIDTRPSRFATMGDTTMTTETVTTPGMYAISTPDGYIHPATYRPLGAACEKRDTQTPNLRGLTLRQALKSLRRVDWGDTGRMLPATLSDGSELAVHNATTDDGQGILLGVHIAVREWVRSGKTRTYKL